MSGYLDDLLIFFYLHTIDFYYEKKASVLVHSRAHLRDTDYSWSRQSPGTHINY